MRSLQEMLAEKHGSSHKPSEYWHQPFEPLEADARGATSKQEVGVGWWKRRLRIACPSPSRSRSRLTQVKPLIADTSMKVGTWWAQLLDCTMKQYGRWQEANALDRLKILPPTASELPSGHERLESQRPSPSTAARQRETASRRVARRCPRIPPRLQQRRHPQRRRRIRMQQQRLRRLTAKVARQPEKRQRSSWQR